MKVEEDSGLDSLLACRICLASDGKLFNIREWGLDQVFVDLMGIAVSKLHYWTSVGYPDVLVRRHMPQFEAWRPDIPPNKQIVSV